MNVLHTYGHARQYEFPVELRMEGSLHSPMGDLHDTRLYVTARPATPTYGVEKKVSHKMCYKSWPLVIFMALLLHYTVYLENKL